MVMSNFINWKPIYRESPVYWDKQNIIIAYYRWPTLNFLFLNVTARESILEMISNSFS